MRVLVTGAGGFAGRKTADVLYANGFDVVGTVHLREADAPFEMVRLDLADAWPDMGRFDAIVHTAGSLPWRTTAYHAHFRNNVDSMRRLIAYAEKQGIHRVINFSTIGVYGEFRAEAVSEQTDRINLDAYGMTKYLAECLLQEAEGIESISLRMPGILGKGACGVWLTNTIEKFRRGDPVYIYTPNFSTRNFVWNDDLATFVTKLLCMESWKYDVVCLAAHEKVTVWEIVQAIQYLTKSTSEIIEDDSIRSPFCIDDRRAVEMGYASISPIEMAERMACDR